MKLVSALILLLALTSSALAADGDLCTEGSTCAVAPPAAQLLQGEKAPNITVMKLCDAKASAGAGAFTCGPIYIPRGGVGFSAGVIRAISGTSAAGCGYDNVSVFTLNSNNTAAGAELPLLGVLDDDGTSTPTGGVQQIMVIGHAPGPYVYVTGTATAGTCNASNTVSIYYDLYPNIVVSK